MDGRKVVVIVSDDADMDAVISSLKAVDGVKDVKVPEDRGPQEERPQGRGQAETGSLSRMLLGGMR